MQTINKIDSLKTSGEWKENFIPIVSFFLLFPGFFIYHTVIGLGLMNAVLGGYFSFVSICILPFLLFKYARSLRNKAINISTIDFFYFLYLLYFFFIVIINYINGANPTIVRNHFAAIIFSSNIFIIFKTINFNSQPFRMIGNISLLIMSLIVFNFTVDGSFYLAALGVSLDPDSVATYQGFSRSYLFTFITVITFTKKIHFRFFLYAIAIATLYLNAARSEFVALLLLVPMIEFYHTKNKLNFILIFIAIIVFIIFFIDKIIFILPHNRTLELLDLSQSTSANLRHHLTLEALHTISGNPFFGDYASYSSGYYSHNFLSAWVDLGFFGIFYITLILIIPAFTLFFYGYFLKTKSHQFILVFSFMCTAILLLLMSHDFTDMLVAATLGAYTKYRYEEKNAKNRAPHISPSSQRHPHFHQTMPQHGSTWLRRYVGGSGQSGPRI